MASRFWKSQPVSGAIVSIASPPQVRLTVASTTGMTTGDVRTVYGVVGTTEANGTWTITVIDAAHIDLQGTTFANLYTSGGKIDGTWDGTNTNNWVSSSNGTDYGQTVPGSSDTVTFDGSSSTGTVTLNLGGSLTIQSLTMGAFTGTWDNSVNNNNITVTASGSCFSLTGSGTRTVKLGSATYTLSNTISAKWDVTSATNLTLSANTATINFTGGAATKSFTGGTSKTYGGTVSFSASSSGGTGTVTTSCTIATLTITAPNYFILPTNATPVVSGTLNLVGSASSQIGVISDTVGSAGNMSLPSSPVATWCSFRDTTFTTNTLIATNSFDLGHNNGSTITVPSQAHFAGGFFS